MKGVVIIVVVVLVIGGVVGAAMTGMVNIPGLTPKKAKPAGQYGEAGGMYGENALAMYGEDASKDAKKKPEKKEESPAKTKPKPKIVTEDAEAGLAKLAGVWNEMKPEDLAKVVEKGWNDVELAKVLAKMDTEKTAKLLSLLPADRAGKLSKALQKEASKLPDAAK
jgi:hypothetical protein